MAAKPPSPGRFIIGLVVGFLLGAIVLMPIAVLSMAAIFSRASTQMTLGFVVIYVLGAILGAWGVWRTVVHLNFLSGLIVGAAAGLLGLTAICQIVAGGLGQMR